MIDLAFLIDSGKELSKCNSIDEINEVVGRNISAILGKSYISITKCDETRRYAKISKLFGFDGFFGSILNILKTDPFKMSFDINDVKKEDLELYTSNRLVDVEEGIFRIMTAKIPKSICRAIEIMLNTNKTYAMGYSNDNKIYGGVVILTKDAIDDNTKNIIESIINNASIIIQRKFAEEALKKSEYKYKILVENISSGIVIVNKEGRIIFVNKKGKEMYGRDNEDLTDKPFSELVNKEILQGLLSDLKEVIKTNLELEREINVLINNKHRWISTRIKPIYDELNQTDFCILIIDDISERKEFERALIKSKKKAEESDKLKTAFLTNLSHEIRTPMNAITGFSQLLADTTDLVEIRDYSNIIKVNSDYLLKLINDIIEISKIEAGIVVVNKTNFSINQSLSDIYISFQADYKIQKQQIELKFKKEYKSDFYVCSDETKFRQILYNLINNAIKFTEKGLVEFGFILKDKSTYEFYVKDTGIGIENEDKEKLFKRFTQLDYSNSRKYTGTGIGLSISKAYIEMLGGKIYFESEKNTGTTFYFTLPC